MRKWIADIKLCRRWVFLSGLMVWHICAFSSHTAADADSLAKILPEVVVDARPQNAEVTSTTPVYHISDTDFSRLAVATAADAVRRMPGITLKDYGGAGGMKTINVRGLSATHTGVSLDGILLSDLRSGQTDISSISLENAEEISLIMGDTDDIFTSARDASVPALISVSSISLPYSKTTPGFTLKGGIGSFGRRQVSARYCQALSRRFAISAFGEYLHAKNDYPYQIKNISEMIRERRSNSMVNMGNVAVNSILRTDAGQLAAKIFYNDSYRQLPGQVKYYTTFSAEKLRDRLFIGQLDYSAALSKKIDFRVDSRFHWSSSRYTDPSYQGNLHDTYYIQREAYISAAVRYTPVSSLQLAYSSDYIFQNLSSEAKMSADCRPIRNAVLQCLSARYHISRLTFTGRLLASLYFNKVSVGSEARDARKISPSLSVSYKILPDDDLYLRASYKNIFRMPTFSESYYFHYGSQNLLPETTDHFNMGLTWSRRCFGNTDLNITADGYFNRIKDMIVAVPYNMHVWTNINVGKAYTAGMDITLGVNTALSASHQLSLDGNYNLQHSTDRTPGSKAFGLQVPYIPQNSGSVSVNWLNPWLNITARGFGASCRWSTAQHYPSTDIPGYFDAGLSLFRGFTVGKKKINRLELRLDINNILNSRYEIIKLYPMPGINYLFTIQYKLLQS